MQDPTFGQYRKKGKTIFEIPRDKPQGFEPM